MNDTTPLDAVLLLYHHFPADNAPTILDHVRSFEECSRCAVIALNTDDGYPRALDGLAFNATVLHYSLFPTAEYFLTPDFLGFLQRSTRSNKIAFFQDDYRYCRRRFDFIDRYGIDTVYTPLEPPYHEEIYRKHSSATRIRTTLTGYVSEALVDSANALTVPDAQRRIDIGYRARRVPYYLGRAGQEKHEIGDRFRERAAGLGLRLDIATGEDSRIYGEAWYEFVAACRGMLGVEAGVSIFDVDDEARVRTDEFLRAHPGASFEDVERSVLHEFEGFPYRVVSPRHFEAAAFRVVQILYEGRYSGVLEPGVHYLELAKDFSNFDDVMTRFSDPETRAAITERAYADLVASGRYSYRAFVAAFDEDLAELGVGERGVDAGRLARLRADLHRVGSLRRVATRVRFARTRPFPGRRLLSSVHRRLRRHTKAPS